MAYRRTDQVVHRLAARRTAILVAARDAAAEGGMAAVQIAPVAERAHVAAGTVYRYFPSKAHLISELIAEVTRNEIQAIRDAAGAAPGPLSALAAAITTIAVHVLENRKLAWAIIAEPVDVDIAPARLSGRQAIAAEIEQRLKAAIAGGFVPAQDTVMSAAAIIGALHEGVIGPLSPARDGGQLREAAQTLTLFTLRAVGVLDARARGLVVQTVMPAREATSA